MSRSLTVLVTRTASEGRLREFEEWMEGIIGAARGFACYMGSSVIQPDPASLECVIIFRFDSYACHNARNRAVAVQKKPPA